MERTEGIRLGRKVKGLRWTTAGTCLDPSGVVVDVMAPGWVAVRFGDGAEVEYRLADGYVEVVR